MRLGILSYGSLIDDPGPELEPLIVEQRAALTPFRVEYGRKSGTRGDAPALCPVKQGGAPVQAEVLLLRADVTVSAARDYLYRRECRIADCACCFGPENPQRFAILDLANVAEVDLALAAAFPQNVAPLEPDEMAARAIRSVWLAPEGRDGITYLLNNLRNGISTPLTDEYRQAILELTESSSLEEARRKARTPTASPAR